MEGSVGFVFNVSVGTREGEEKGSMGCYEDKLTYKEVVRRTWVGTKLG